MRTIAGQVSKKSILAHSARFVSVTPVDHGAHESHTDSLYNGKNTFNGSVWIDSYVKHVSSKLADPLMQNISAAFASLGDPTTDIFSQMSLEVPDLVHETETHTVSWYKNDGCIMNDPEGNFQYGMYFMPNGKTKCVHSDGSSYEISGMQDTIQKYFEKTK